MRIKLERIQRECLWGDLEERRKIHLVSWSVICKDKKHGGLGLRHLRGFQSSFARKMTLELSPRKGEFLEESHYWKIWRGGKGLDH